MPGKAYIADVVKRDMQRLQVLFRQIANGLGNGFDVSESMAEAKKILDSYNE